MGCNADFAISLKNTTCNFIFSTKDQKLFTIVQLFDLETLNPSSAALLSCLYQKNLEFQSVIRFLVVPI